MPEDITYLYAKAKREGKSIADMLAERGADTSADGDASRIDPVYSAESIRLYNLVLSKQREMMERMERMNSQENSDSSSRHSSSTSLPSSPHPAERRDLQRPPSSSSTANSSTRSLGTASEKGSHNGSAGGLGTSSATRTVSMSGTPYARRSYEDALAASKPGNGWGGNMGSLLALTSVRVSVWRKTKKQQDEIKRQKASLKQEQQQEQLKLKQQHQQQHQQKQQQHHQKSSSGHWLHGLLAPLRRAESSPAASRDSPSACASGSSTQHCGSHGEQSDGAAPSKQASADDKQHGSSVSMPTTLEASGRDYGFASPRLMMALMGGRNTSPERCPSPERSTSPERGTSPKGRTSSPSGKAGFSSPPAGRDGQIRLRGVATVV
mmetsp:Transcript_15210/g.30076  ORF Transcript_15210/g.30076 Transcript_15210/m.30076 type:complete len:380 (-) Transcript_15210:214-1353(-)